MAQHVMVIAVKLENLGSIPRAHIVGKRASINCPMTSTCMQVSLWNS